MKRRVEEKVPEEEKVFMPLELFGPISQQYVPHNFGEIYRFILLCRTAEQQLLVVLKNWVLYLVPGRGVNPIYTMSSMLDHYHDTILLPSLTEEEEKERKKNENAFLLDLFEWEKLRLLAKFWSSSPNWGPNGNSWCQKYRHSIFSNNSQISRFFYHDQETDKVIPMENIPDLREVAFSTTDSSELISQISTLYELTEQPAHRVAIMKNGLKNSSLTELVTHLCETSLEYGSMETLEADQNTKLRDVVIHGYSFYSKDPYVEFLVDNLYTCSFVPTPKMEEQAYPEYCKEYVILQYATLQKKMDALISKYDLYLPTSPQYSPTSPQYAPTSPQYLPTSPEYFYDEGH